MMVQVDYGPDTPEEIQLKQMLSELQQSYQRQAQPIIDQLVRIQVVKAPRSILMFDVTPGSYQ